MDKNVYFTINVGNVHQNQLYKSDIASLNSKIHILEYFDQYFRSPCNIPFQFFKILRLSTHLQTKSAIVYSQIADFVRTLLQNKSNMIWNFLLSVHTCSLSMNNRRTLSIDTSSRFCLQVCTKPEAWSCKRDFSSSPIEKSPADLSRAAGRPQVSGNQTLIEKFA